MIYVVVGDNAYRAEQEIRKLRAAHPGDERRVDGADVTTEQLAELLMGNSLFTSAQFIVVNGLGANSAAWQKLGEWLERLNTETTLVLVEQKLDKRTKTYKQLAKHGEIITLAEWTDRDARLAVTWLKARAESAGVELSTEHANAMVLRAMVPTERPGRSVIDQLRLLNALRSLQHAGAISDEAIEAVLPPTSEGIVFDLLELAVHRQQKKLQLLLDDLRHRDEPYRVFAMVLKEWSQLVMVGMSGQPKQVVADEFKIHPFVVEKLQGFAREFSQTELRTFTQLAAQLDADMKQKSTPDPWMGVERFLFGLSTRK